MPVAAMTVSLILLTLLAWGQPVGPDIPSVLWPPKGAKLVLVADAKGFQIYTCEQQNGQYLWAFKAPEAQLFDKRGKVIGRHFAGPSWELNDNSAVTGKIIEHADAPDKEAIPWLLLAVVSHSGRGKLTNVTYIQRVNTKRGKAPAAGCGASSASNEARSPYSATYRFYKSKGEGMLSQF